MTGREKLLGAPGTRCADHLRRSLSLSYHLSPTLESGKPRHLHPSPILYMLNLKTSSSRNPATKMHRGWERCDAATTLQPRFRVFATSMSVSDGRYGVARDVGDEQRPDGGARRERERGHDNEEGWSGSGEASLFSVIPEVATLCGLLLYNHPTRGYFFHGGLPNRIIHILAS
jgi:hypothetical protein